MSPGKKFLFLSVSMKFWLFYTREIDPILSTALIYAANICDEHEIGIDEFYSTSLNSLGLTS